MVRISQNNKRRMEELVILVLRQRGRAMSTNELAKTLGRSWAFTNKLLRGMGKKGLAKKTVYGVGHFWDLR